jgi:hypothetical protein
VLYYLVFGVPPHRGDNVADVLAQVVSGRPVAFPVDNAAESNSALIAVCRRSLTKAQPERYESAAELARAIEAAGALMAG